MSTDAIVILKEDHKEIRRAFREFAATEDTATAQRADVVNRIAALLTRHTYIENEVMYPRVRELVPELDKHVLDSYEEHHVADVLISELSAMEPYEERFAAKARVLIESVEHHIEEEERDWFPLVRAGLGRNKLQEIGRELLEAKDRAPRSPAGPSPLAKVAKAVFD